MISEISFTLLGEGPSDRALIPVLRWLLAEHLAGCAIQPAWADLNRLKVRPRGLDERISWAIELYPCDLLFIHRDADREPREMRVREIQQARASAAASRGLLPTIPVVPVRMLEAWLPFNEMTIRNAVSNPNGRMALGLPRAREVELLPDPKRTLRDLFLEASGLGSHRRRDVRPDPIRVADFTDDFAPLRGLPAFRALEADVQQMIAEQGWGQQDR
jgi:hypothetical protein